MPRLIAALLAPALLLVVAPAAPVPKDRSGPRVYFATTVGDRWVYRYTHDGAVNEVTEVVTGVERDGGVTVVLVGRVNGGEVTPYARWRVSGEGLAWSDGSPGRQKRDPIRRLKLPAKPGDNWEWALSPESRVKMVETFRGEEEVEVPAGRFKALQVDGDASESGVMRMTIWYAPGVGSVKQVTKSGSSELTIVLKSFTPGKR